MLTGVFTALATPFLPDGALDIFALRNLLAAQIKAGVHGIVLLGTTAETPALTADEKKEIINTCINEIRKNGLQLIIGAGTNNTVSTRENLRQLYPFHPDAALVVTPYYNKPNLSGLIGHYKAAAQEGLPLVLYHIPGRTGQKLSGAMLDTLLREVPQIIGVKESDYDMSHVTDCAVKYTGKLSYLCGNDDLFPHFLALQSTGIISAAANVLAPGFVKIYNLFQAGKTREAFDVFTHIYPLIKACYLETNPTCIKYLLSKLQDCTPTLRAPLGPISSQTQAQLDAILARTEKEFLI